MTNSQPPFPTHVNHQTTKLQKLPFWHQPTIFRCYSPCTTSELSAVAFGAEIFNIATQAMLHNQRFTQLLKCLRLHILQLSTPVAVGSRRLLENTTRGISPPMH